MNRARRAAAVLVTLTMGCGMVSCGSGDDDGDDGGGIAGIVVIDAWTRPSPATVTDAAFYVTLENVGAADGEVVALGSDRCVTVVPHMTSFDDGIASMTAIGDALMLPAGGSIEMEPNGLHLMCLGIGEPFASGDSFVVDIEFAEQGLVGVPVVVADR